jgi:hypothetical protein
MIDQRYSVFLTDHLCTHQIRHSGRDFYSHLKGTHDLLERWGNPKAICLAGLFHSIYGTWHFRRTAFPIERRYIIQELIGEEAEFLAYVFCVTKRPKEFIANIGASETLLTDHHAKEVLRLSDAQLIDLLEIEAANLLEQGGKIKPVLKRLLAATISNSAKNSISQYLATATTVVL